MIITLLGAFLKFGLISKSVVFKLVCNMTYKFNKIIVIMMFVLFSICIEEL